MDTFFEHSDYDDCRICTKALWDVTDPAVLKSRKCQKCWARFKRQEKEGKC